MVTRRDVLIGGAAAVLCSRWPLGAPAAAEVVKGTARIIVGFAAGGGTDVLARILADKLKGVYAPAMIVENRPGAATRIAIEYVKNAEPDGSVILFTPDFPITVYPYSFKSLNYDSIRDFIPVAPFAKSALTYSVGPSVPAGIKTLGEFMAWCKANPNNATYATTAAGGTPHFAGLMLASEASVQMTPVHYKGGAPALQDLIGGHVSSSVNPISETLPFASTGSIRILAVTSEKRSSFLPDVPTMKESGYNVVAEPWLGALVPAKTPSETVKALNAAIGDIAKSPEIVQKLASLGNEATYQSPDEFAATVRSDLERWAPVVKASGFVAD